MVLLLHFLFLREVELFVYLVRDAVFAAIVFFFVRITTNNLFSSTAASHVTSMHVGSLSIPILGQKLTRLVHWKMR